MYVKNVKFLFFRSVSRSRSSTVDDDNRYRVFRFRHNYRGCCFIICVRVRPTNVLKMYTQTIYIRTGNKILRVVLAARASREHVIYHRIIVYRNFYGGRR